MRKVEVRGVEVVSGEGVKNALWLLKFRQNEE